MLTDDQRRFLGRQRVARLATADADGCPHVVPICFVAVDNSVYLTIDEKPKRASKVALKRIANIRENPRVAVVADHYEEDWSALGWVMVQGRAEVLESGDEHGRAQARLRERYRQLARMHIEALPVIAIRIAHVISWGKLSPPQKD